ncbi:MAG TPA: SRPBCC domain-containing protein [Candidatus Baltobacteraceae bacterium]|jgi:uncharacterized protein YndB with AHSA1/START domain|nr:SRPBCC domain-containing protein [Candidatus Baltobacteraceae bacterium]
MTAKPKDQLISDISESKTDMTPTMTIVRIFDAPRPLVFEAFTNPKHLVRWWGPHGFTTPLCEVDVRPGGAIHIDMRGPDGTIYTMKGAYHEVVEFERLSWSNVVDDTEGKPSFELLQIIALNDHEGKTKLTLQVYVLMSTPQAAESLGGMETGWSQSLERLKGLLFTL